MQSDQTFIQKTFQMINELTNHISFFPIKVLYLPSTRQINISRAINDIHNNGLCLNNCHIFYLDNFKRLFVHIGTFPFPKSFELLLKYQLFLQTTIKIRYRKIHGQNTSKDQKKVPVDQQASKKKSRKQKTIQEVMDLVTKWRDLFQMTDSKGKRMYTLETAAQQMGMQKKTLDDYYYKIKKAQANGFDVQKNKNQKIGFLRQFVKECSKNNKNKVSNINQKSGNFPNQSNNNKNSTSFGWNGFVSGASGCYKGGFAIYPPPQTISPSAPCMIPKPPEDQIDKYLSDEFHVQNSNKTNFQSNQTQEQNLISWSQEQELLQSSQDSSLSQNEQNGGKMYGNKKNEPKNNKKF